MYAPCRAAVKNDLQIMVAPRAVPREGLRVCELGFERHQLLGGYCYVPKLWALFFSKSPARKGFCAQKWVPILRELYAK